MYSASTNTYATVFPRLHGVRPRGASQRDVEAVMSSSHAQPLLLSIAELRELSGYRNHAPQISWLVGNSIPYVVDSSGRPRVLRRVIEQRLGFRENGTDSDAPAIATSADVESRPRPNFTSLVVATLRAKGYRGS